MHARMNHLFTVLLLVGLAFSTPILAEENQDKGKASENTYCKITLSNKETHNCTTTGLVLVIQGILADEAAKYCDFTKTIVSVSDGPFLCIRK